LGWRDIVEWKRREVIDNWRRGRGKVRRWQRRVEIVEIVEIHKARAEG
jgi:hypothetical protein